MLRRNMMRNDENDNLTYTGTSAQDTLRRGMLLIVLLTTLLFLFPLTASAHTLANGAGTGRIYGQLLDGTKKNAPVAGQSVTLQMAQGNNGSGLTKATTDGKGRYTFRALNPGKTLNYAVYTL